MSHEALTFGEKEPASGHKSLRSGHVRKEELKIRGHQDGRVLDQAASGLIREAPDAVRTHRT